MKEEKPIQDNDTFDIHLELLRETCYAYSEYVSLQRGEEVYLDPNDVIVAALESLRDFSRLEVSKMKGEQH